MTSNDCSLYLGTDVIWHQGAAYPLTPPQTFPSPADTEKKEKIKNTCLTQCPPCLDHNHLNQRPTWAYILLNYINNVKN